MDTQNQIGQVQTTSKSESDNSAKAHVSQEPLRKSGRLPAAVFEISPDGTIQKVTGTIGTLTRLHHAELTGLNLWDIFSSDLNQPAVQFVVDQTLRSDLHEVQLTIRGAEGYPIAIEVNTHNQYNTSGSLEKIICFICDVTAVQLSEEALIHNEKRFRHILESVQDYAIYMLGIDGTITSWNTGAQTIKGYLEPEVIGKNFSMFFPEQDRDSNKPQRLLELAKRDGKYEEESWRVRKNGSLFWASILITPIYDSVGNHLGFSKVVRDMSRRKKDEEQLRRQWNYIRLLQDIAVASNEAGHVEDALRDALRRICDQTGWNVGHALVVSDQYPVEASSLRTWYFSDPYRFESFRAATESTSFPAGKGIPGKVLAQTVPIWIDNIASNMTSTRQAVALECGMKTGAAFPILIGKSVVGVLEFYSLENLQRDEQFMQVMSQVGTQLGRVIERDRSEQALRASEARFRTIFENAALGIELIDLDGHILESNAAVAEMVGYTVQELRELSLLDVHHPANLVAQVDFFKDIQANRRNSFRVERSFIHKDGRLAWSRISASLMRDPSGNPMFIVSMLEDITEQRQMEAELVELQRSIMDGRETDRLHLAQELHDGPLQDLYGISYQLKAISKGFAPENNRQTEDLQMLMTQVISKLRSICKDLRPPTLAPFGLEKAIRAHAEAYADENAIDILLDLQPDGQMLPEKVRLALFRIYQQTIINVMRHAGADQVKVHFRFDEKEIVLEIVDNGKGFVVPDKWIELARQGHMGLIGAAERAAAIGGKLSVESDPQSGTQVRVVAPRNTNGTNVVYGG